MNPYSVVDALEKRVAEYAGAEYGVAVDSCTNALKLSLVLSFMLGETDRRVWLPKHTYVGVAYAVLAAGGVCRFRSLNWEGAYVLSPHRTNEEVYIPLVVDSARRFHEDMYLYNTLYCLSFHWYKHLPIGKGGMILTDNKKAYKLLKKMRYDGRTPGGPDRFDTPGFHCYMAPEEAARGLMLMNNVNRWNEDLPKDNYPDLSQYPIFQRGYR